MIFGYLYICGTFWLLLRLFIMNSIFGKQIYTFLDSLVQNTFSLPMLQLPLITVSWRKFIDWVLCRS